MEALPVQQIILCDPFWTPRLETNARRAIFHQWKQLEASDCIDNFRIAAGEKVGLRQGWFFADSDATQWLDAGGKRLTFIPYHLWATRGESQMTVWINV